MTRIRAILLAVVIGLLSNGGRSLSAQSQAPSGIDVDAVRAERSIALKPLGSGLLARVLQGAVVGIIIVAVLGWFGRRRAEREAAEDR